MEPVSLVAVISTRNGSMYPYESCIYVSISILFPYYCFLLYAVYALLYEGSYKDNVFQFN